MNFLCKILGHKEELNVPSLQSQEQALREGKVFICRRCRRIIYLAKGISDDPRN